MQNENETKAMWWWGWLRFETLIVAPLDFLFKDMHWIILRVSILE